MKDETNFRDSEQPGIDEDREGFDETEGFHTDEGVEIAGDVVEEVDQVREELHALNDQHLRLAAEFDNYRKRNERDRKTLATRLQSDLVVALLDVLDDLQRIADSAPDTAGEAVLEGVRLVEKKFIGVLEGAGLDPIDADGAQFDPELMEALMMVPTDEPAKDGHVADVFQKGYRFRDAMVRPARVRVWQFDDESGSSE